MLEKDYIINGSKLIAKFLGWEYIPFNDLQGLKKAGWYKVVPNKPCIEDTKIITKTIINGVETIKEEIIKQDLNYFRYNTKNGWTLNEGNYYKYICRSHSELRFFNSFDSLIPVIQKIEEEYNISFFLGNEGCKSGYGLYSNDLFDEISSFELDLTWIQNTFVCVVETLKNLQK